MEEYKQKLLLFWTEHRNFALILIALPLTFLTCGVVIVSYFALMRTQEANNPVSSQSSPEKTTVSEQTTDTSTQQTTTSAAIVPKSGSQSAQSVIKQTTPNPTQSSGTSQTTNVPANTPGTGTISPNPTSVGLANTNQGQTAAANENKATDIKIVFQDENGNLQTYTPPPTPPVQVTWSRYTNQTDRYTIDYPNNWTMIPTTFGGHEGISIYPPGVDQTDPNIEYIGLGWAQYYSLPSSGNLSAPYILDIKATGVSGKLYTKGTIGNSYIAAIFPYRNGFVGIASNVSTNEILYIMQHMLVSLTFF